MSDMHCASRKTSSGVLNAERVEEGEKNWCGIRGEAPVTAVKGQMPCSFGKQRSASRTEGNATNQSSGRAFRAFLSVR